LESFAPTFTEYLEQVDRTHFVISYGGWDKLRNVVEDFVSRIVSLNEMDTEKAYKLAKEVYKELRRKDVTFRRFYDAVIDTPWGKVYIEYKSLNNLKACSKTIIQALVDKYHAAKKGMVIIWVFESENHPTAVAIKSFLSGDVITVGSVKREELADAIARALAAKYRLNAEEIKQALLAGKLKVHGDGGARLAQSLTEEEVGLARRLSNWVKKHWDLIARVATTTARVAFEEYCKHNPPKSPEEAQLARAFRGVHCRAEGGSAAHFPPRFVARRAIRRVHVHLHWWLQWLLTFLQEHR
jgi:hypothetical protein